MSSSSRFALAAAAAAACVAAAPATAAAATKTVTAGPHKSIRSAPDGSDINAYFPKKIKVRKGDKVRFEIRGFHDVYFPGRGGRPPGLVTADPSKPISGVNDAAGQPFWFNGQPRLLVRPELMGPTGDGRIDRSKRVDSSGIPGEGDGPPPPYEVKFTKRGAFTYHCNVHDGMKGKVKVVGRRARVPGRRADSARADRQLARAVRKLKKRDRFDGPSGANVQVGNDTRELAFFRFFPGKQTVRAGEPVRFTFPGRSGELHNVAVGPEEYIKAQSDGLIAPDLSTTPPALVLNPIALLPSDPPGAFPPHSAGLHGNGFINVGALDTVGATPNPNQGTITFSQPGTYTVYCIIHAPDMKGTIEVTG